MSYALVLRADNSPLGNGVGEGAGHVLTETPLVVFGNDRSLGLVAFALGIVATQRGLGLAVDLGAAVITLLSLATIGLLATQQLPGGSVGEPTCAPINSRS